MVNERSGRSARPEGRSRKHCKRDAAQPSIVNDVLRQGFRLAYRQPRLIFFDLIWKSIWLVLTVAGLFVVAVWFGTEFISMGWADTGNRAINGAIAVALLRRFWTAYRTGTFVSLAAVAGLSVIAWFVFEAAFRSKLYSPARRGTVAAVHDRRQSIKFEIAGGHRPPLQSLSQEGNVSFRTFLLSNVLKSLLIVSAALALAGICFGRYLAAPLSEWPQLWPDTRGGAVVGVVATTALGFLLTILDTLVRNDAIELLGTDLFRVTGLITILLSFEMILIASCAVMLGTGLLKVAGWESAVAMLVATAAAVGLLNVLHSYLLLVRYLAVGILRQNVVEI